MPYGAYLQRVTAKSTASVDTQSPTTSAREDVNEVKKEPIDNDDDASLLADDSRDYSPLDEDIDAETHVIAGIGAS